YQISVANTAGQENAAAKGDLDLTEANHTVTIQGAGAGATIIDGGGLDRVFQVLGNVNAVFRNLTIRNGNAQDDGVAGIPLVPTDSHGGGILNQGSATLDHVVVEACSAPGTRGGDGAPGQDGTPGKTAQGAGI